MTVQEGDKASGSSTLAGKPSGPDARRDVNNVAMLIDWDNFYSQCAERGIIVQPARLKEVGRRAGRIRWSAVFVDATRLTLAQRTELFQEGFDICDCPKLPTAHSSCLKDTVDAAIIERLHALADFVEVDEILLGSADRDYLRVVQHLRDSGKRVRILTPTPKDHPTLMQHSDGCIAYALAEATEGLARDLAEVFNRGTFVQAGPRAQAELRSLAIIVVLMDGRLNVNGRDVGFRRLLDDLARSDEARAQNLTPDGLKERVEFLIDREVVLKEQDERKYYRYRVARRHPFVAYAYHVMDSAAFRPPASQGRVIESVS
ncbi:MAG TPA: NYN domain-containing protein [Candidatus Binatia bacterium]|nr:NYN domain-containing protein [Candidatus Binatia bacterium]